MLTGIRVQADQLYFGLQVSPVLMRLIEAETSETVNKKQKDISIMKALFFKIEDLNKDVVTFESTPCQAANVTVVYQSLTNSCNFKVTISWDIQNFHAEATKRERAVSFLFFCLRNEKNLTKEIISEILNG